MITLTDKENVIHELKIIKFSDGAINIKVPDECENIEVVSWLVDDVVTETVAMQYLEQLIYKKFATSSLSLFMPYVPNARADRVFESGMISPLELTVIDLQISLFLEITVWDVHSDVFESKLGKLNKLGKIKLINIKHQHEIIRDQFYKQIKDTIIVSPDKGATEKAKLVAEMFNSDLVQGFKERDVTTGQITKIGLPEGDYKGKRFTICDDICDGGGTFLPLAKQLKEAGASEVNLYVTHGIFAKGLDMFKENFNNIYVANIVGKYITTSDLQSFNLRKGK